MLGISERSLGRWRAELEALGLVVKSGARWVYRREGLREAYLSVAGLQVGNAATVARMHREVARQHTSRHQQGPSIEDHNEITDPGDSIPPWAESKARREFYLAEREKLALARVEGTLVDRDAIKKMLFEENRRARDALQRFAVLLPP